MHKKIVAIGVLCFILNAFAFTIDEKHPVKMAIHIQPTNLAQTTTKDIILMNVKLTPSETKLFSSYRSNNESSITMNLPSKIEVGMNGVPVLDQGMHGSCVTFANTAAVDAVLGKGDYVSQLCQLELGSYLQDRATFYPSGWNGSWGPFVLNQMLDFGIVSKEIQYSQSCAGVREYPAKEAQNTGNALSLDEYKLLRENLRDQHIDTKEILNVNVRLGVPDSAADAYNGDKLLTQVKTYLLLHSQDQGMLTFGAFLLSGNCGSIACGKYHTQSDTWVLNDYSKNHPDQIVGGHEMVITGYDDNAVAIDNNGKKHIGLLTLRNSWGISAGDRGNYYMTYDYFKQTAIELNKVYIAH